MKRPEMDHLAVRVHLGERLTADEGALLVMYCRGLEETVEEYMRRVAGLVLQREDAIGRAMKAEDELARMKRS